MDNAARREAEIEAAWSIHREQPRRGSRFARHRFRLAEAQNWRCCWCQEPMDHDTASIEHIVPRSLGGPDVLKNIAIAHRDCNNHRPSTDAELQRLAKLFGLDAERGFEPLRD